ncbi:hypothetical protein BG20_I0583 [Candidatus Nitrosarchaeum limnium BG20]|uniref:Uncharacterized protein n=1 Tax=Candidatus Nitrosarchaeum limnium BG20 TaxID=859192 RepID=S2E4R9_9ARCH|nr:hypothetical protein BG20_I0583 [Candidatus Nitrosarchaeum limnium BG20]
MTLQKLNHGGSFGNYIITIHNTINLKITNLLESLFGM